MKKIFLTTILIIGLVDSIQLFSQTITYSKLSKTETLLTPTKKIDCKVSSLFPVVHNITKFDAIQTLNNISSIHTSDILPDAGSWEIIDYLKEDSNYRVTLYYDIDSYSFHPCINGNENTLRLAFSDDKLYWMVIEMTFIPSEYSKMNELYNGLIFNAKNIYHFESKGVVSNPDNKEKIGEGYIFTNCENLCIKKCKELAITKTIKYKRIYYDEEWHSTGQIENYIIEIRSLDLSKVKLNFRGY